MLEKILKLSIIVTAFTVLILIGLSLFADKNGKTDPYFLGSQNKPVLEIFKEKDTVTPLVQSEVAKLPGKYALYIKDLKNNDVFTVNPDESFGSASIYKLAVMYKTFDALSRGDANKNEVDNALKAMITISDNDSAILLAERFGWSNIDKFMETEGFGGINLVGENSPNVTARAVGDLLERIYRNKAVNHIYSEEMKQLLFAQTINDRIPKYLPKDVKVGHKTGELDTVRHDAGIVLGKKADYIFVILSDTPAPGEAPEHIARLSEKIFEELED